MKIEEIKSWSMESIRRACIKNRLYTAGDCEEYEQMLRTASQLKPNIGSIYTIAKDIFEHSEDETLTSVMFCLANDAVMTYYEIEED